MSLRAVATKPKSTIDAAKRVYTAQGAWNLGADSLSTIGGNPFDPYKNWTDWKNFEAGIAHAKSKGLPFSLIVARDA